MGLMMVFAQMMMTNPWGISTLILIVIPMVISAAIMVQAMTISRNAICVATGKRLRTTALSGMTTTVNAFRRKTFVVQLLLGKGSTGVTSAANLVKGSMMDGRTIITIVFKKSVWEHCWWFV